VGWGTPFATACNTLNELLLAAANAVAYSGTHLRPAIYQTLYITDSLTVLAIFFPVDTSSYAVWSENNHTNTYITLETNE
jgi:hypothetical protein